MVLRSRGLRIWLQLLSRFGSIQKIQGRFELIQV